MIVQLTGTLVEVTPSHVVLDVGGVGYELGVSATTAAGLPAAGEAGVTLLARLVVRQEVIALFGFATRDERAVFDRLTAISGVGPKLALAVLSTFTPADVAQVVTAGDSARMATVPGVGKKKAERLLLELKGAFSSDPQLVGLAAVGAGPRTVPDAPEQGASEVTSALLGMGFSSQEVDLALEGHEDAGATSAKDLLAYALRRLGGGA